MTACLADHGKHHWKYLSDDQRQPRLRECQKCGVLQQRRPNGRYVPIGSTRWTPLSDSEIAAELQEQLGQRLVAYGVGISSPKLVGCWAAGINVPRDETATRLRVLYRVVRALNQHYEPSTIRAFLMGANPDLGDRAPIDVIRENQGVEVVRAAEVFLDA